MFIQVSPKITLYYQVGGDHTLGIHSHKAVNGILLFLLLERLYVGIYYHICWWHNFFPCSLIKTVRNTLQDLEKAIKGVVVMDSALEALSGSLLVGKVPEIWAQRSYPSLKPLGSYITDFLARLNFLQVKNYI